MGGRHVFSSPTRKQNDNTTQPRRQTRSKATRGTQRRHEARQAKQRARHAEHDITSKQHSPDPNKERHYPRQAPHTGKQAGEQTARPSVVMTNNKAHSPPVIMPSKQGDYMWQGTRQGTPPAKPPTNDTSQAGGKNKAKRGQKEGKKRHS